MVENREEIIKFIKSYNKCTNATERHYLLCSIPHIIIKCYSMVPSRFLSSKNIDWLNFPANRQYVQEIDDAMVILAMLSCEMDKAGHYQYDLSMDFVGACIDRIYYLISID